MRTILVPGFLLLISLTACSGDDKSCTDLVKNISSLESEYGCSDTKYGLDVPGLSEDLIIIRNQSEFNNRVTGNCLPDIDFSTYDLVIGKKQLTTGNESIDYKMTESCETGEYILEVTFHQNIAAEAPNLTYHSLIPKLEEGKEPGVLINVVW